MNEASRIKEMLTAREVAAHYGFYPNRNGYICCPFHNEKTGSLKIYDGHDGWHCFGCHKGGSVIDFVRELDGLSFSEACKKLDRDFNLGLYREKTFRERRAISVSALKAAQERQEKAAQQAYTDEQYKILCRYRRWLRSHGNGPQASFDIEFMDRLLDKYMDSDAVITFSAEALVNALLSKHQNRGEWDRDEQLAYRDSSTG